MLFKLESSLFFHIFDDLGISLLEEGIGFSQYLFDIFVFEGLFHDVLPFCRITGSHFMKYMDQRLIRKPHYKV